MSDRVVAVDVGNSAVKLALDSESVALSGGRSDPLAAASSVAGGEPGLVGHVVSLSQADWHDELIDWVLGQAGNEQLSWRIASVHRAAAERLGKVLADRLPATPIHVVTCRDVPMRILVDHPERLGIDRLLGAYAAQRRLGSPLVVVDAGSAVTVDWVNHAGGFGGGAILPGVELQLAVLAAETDALPRIDFRRPAHRVGPGRNTAEAITLGVLTGVAATVERLVRESQVPVILTGGDARLIAERLNRDHQLAENLVCRGLLDLPTHQFQTKKFRDQLN